MKKIIWILFLLPFLSGCRKTDAGFDMTYRRTFTIPVGLNTFETHFFLFKEIAVDTSLFFRANNIDTVSLVGQIVPRSMNIRLVFNGDGNLNFVRRVEVSLFDTQTSASSEKVVYYNDDVQLSSGGQVTLIPYNSDVRKLFISGNGRYNLRIKINLREIPTRSYDVEWNAVFLAKT
jgi:hypothetical protein